MDENEIVALIKEIPQKLSDKWPDYPCDRCSKADSNCTTYRDCAAWRRWFHNRYVEIDQKFGVVRKNGKQK